MTKTVQYDIAIIGAGIVGLATARSLNSARPDLSIVIVDKESAIAAHQTGNNSGVIHSGIYYKPGSAKAELAVEGRRRMIEYCQHHGVDFEMCGKVILSTGPSDEVRLTELERRGKENGVSLKRMSAAELTEREPSVKPGEALLVTDAGIVDYGKVCVALQTELVGLDIDILTNFEVTKIRSDRDSITLEAANGSAVSAGWLINCAGLQSDRMVGLTGVTPPAAIMPFRGEYLHLRAERRHLCQHLIYPVPDPDFPFLGAHFTRDVTGGIHVGPNAVPAFAREGYSWGVIDWGDVREMLTRRSTWKLAKRYWRTGAGEIYRSLRTKALVDELRRLVPDTEVEDLERAPAGVRAQAIAPTGDLLDDFVFHDTPRAVHVINAPSPAATASLAIGERIADRLTARMSSG